MPQEQEWFGGKRVVSGSEESVARSAQKKTIGDTSKLIKDRWSKRVKKDKKE